MFEAPSLIEFTRWYLAAFFTGVALFYTVRILYLKRSTQKEMIFPGARFCATWWNHMAFRVFRVLIWFVCVLRAFIPSIDAALWPMASLQTPLVIGTGVLLLSIGFLATITIHLRFCEEWRSGIDPRGPAEIRQDGIYAYSRNPMFVFVAISQWGFFLALPSVFSLVCLVVGLSALYRQTLSEEAHLIEVFPKSYPHYCREVRRWI